jgi:uncharacterized membrane protein
VSNGLSEAAMISWAARFQLREYVKGSLWVVPVVGGALGPLVAQVTLFLDDRIELPPSWDYSPSTASGLLTTIVGAIVALLGFVVTIGVLVIQQATGTLSPRYMRLWYRNRLQKVVLATFAGTLTYSFSLLRRISDDFVPDIGVTVAGVAVTVSLALLLLYLDRFTHSLRPVAVATLVGAAGQKILLKRRPRLFSHLPDVLPGPACDNGGRDGRPASHCSKSPPGRSPGCSSPASPCRPHA